MIDTTVPNRPSLARSLVGRVSRPAGTAGRDGRPGGTTTAYPILTTWPPAEHSFGPMPLAGAMLQFET